MRTGMVIKDIFVSLSSYRPEKNAFISYDGNLAGPLSRGTEDMNS